MKNKAIALIAAAVLLVGCTTADVSNGTVDAATEPPVSITTTTTAISLATEKQTPIKSDFLVRESSQAMFIEGLNEEFGANAIDKAISDMPYVHYGEFSTPADIEWIADENAYGYKINNIKRNIFVCDNMGIIDPAFMIGIPIIESTYSKIAYNFQGIRIEVDTLGFPCDLEDGYYEVEGDFLYSCDEKNRCEIEYSIDKVISSDAAIYKMFESARMSNDAKEPQITSTYNALIKNIDKINTDDTSGIVLVDLDFDEIPELLVSKTKAIEYPNPYENEKGEIVERVSEKVVCDVAIYRIDGEEIKYIDTFYNNNMLVYENGNTIGLKELEGHCEKQWFITSYKNAKTGEISDIDYLIKLSGDEIIYTEIFSQRDNKYFHMGKEMQIETVMTAHPYGEDETVLDWESSVWDGIQATFGDWELYGFARKRYAEDITTSYNLYSDWLVSDFAEYSTLPTKRPITPRMMEFRLMYLVDSFYYGIYDPQKFSKSYEFLGDYAKPVIYLYPESTIDVKVEVEIENGKLTSTWPKYNDGWSVTAYPDGTLVNKADGYDYSYLYWEGEGEVNWDMTRGFVVKGEDTGEFLREKLSFMGLSAREYNEFIVYWLPLMEKNAYNLIAFQTEDYEKMTKLIVTPEPDSILRIFMTYLPLEEYVEIPEQELKAFSRTGFCVIEWGGAMLKHSAE